MPSIRPPRAWEKLLRSLLFEEAAEERLGDFEEGFRDIAARRGALEARAWYIRQTLKFLPVHTKNSIFGGFLMLRNYFKIGLRNLQKRMGYALLNIGGLAAGLAVGLMILAYIRTEKSFDSFHEAKNRIVRIERRYLDPDGSINGGFAGLAPSFAPHLRNVAGIENAARLLSMKKFGDSFVRSKDGEKAFKENRFFLADAEFLGIFNLPFVEGDPKTALANPNAVVLSRSTARRYFGTEPALGKTIRFENSWFGAHLFQVTGVMKDMPPNSHVHFDFLGSLITAGADPRLKEYLLGTQNFLDNVVYVYALLAPGASPAAISALMPGLLDRLVPPRTDESRRLVNTSRTDALFLRRLADIHLDGDAGDELEPNGNRKTLGYLLLIALAILLLACINFANLSTAQASRRAREVGLRKVVGGRRRMLAVQFLAESFLVVFLAFLLAASGAVLLLPLFGALAGRTINPRILFSPGSLPAVGLVLLFTSLAAGLYPAFYISAFKPSTILRGELTRGARGGFLRKALVVFQFAISVVLIICVGVVGRQVRYIRNVDLGLDRDNIVLLPVNETIKRSWAEVRDALTAYPSIRAAALSMGGPADPLSNGTRVFLEIDGRTAMAPNIVLERIRASLEFFRTYGVTFVAGRDFSPEYPTDAIEAFILNESAVRLLGLKTPRDAIGTPIGVERNAPLGRVIGVVANFHYESLREKVKPVIAFIPRNNTLLNRLSVRLAPGDPRPALAQMRSVLARISPGLPFDPVFLDDRLNALYADEQRMMSVFEWTGGLAIGIAVLGLFGLASYSAEQRTREIGIRKILGASTAGLAAKMSRQYLLWVLTANAIAFPASYLLMRGWLKGFAYRIPIGWTVFASTCALTIAIAFLTVASQSIRAAMANPSQSLKHE